MSQPLIALAGFHHETNTFAPQKTAYEEFVKDDGWPGLVTGEHVIAALEPLNLGMGGFIKAVKLADVADRSEAASQALSEKGGMESCGLAPILWCNAEPFAHVTEDAYERIVGRIIEEVSQLAQRDRDKDDSYLAAIYLCLHGAMVAEHTEDGEGELLRRLRAVVGEELPIVISLDLHANVTPDMFNFCDAMTIFRTYPHVDMAETGQRAFELLLPMIETGNKPAKCYQQGEFLLPLTAQYTGATPASAIYQQVVSAVAGDVYSCDFACGFPPADIPHCGPACVAYASTPAAAASAVKAVCDRLHSLESEFAGELLEASEAVELATRLSQQALQQTNADKGAKPVVIADVQDNPGAGGSGDTTGLLLAMVQARVQNAVFATLWDPLAAQQIIEVGEGGTLTAELGGRNGPEGVTPFAADFEVLKITDGRFMGVGPMMRGTEYKLGPMALLRVLIPGLDLKVIVTSERAQCLDRGFLLTMGLEPQQLSIIAVKSTVHFRNDFESLADHILLASCPGANPCRLQAIPYTRLRQSVRLPHAR